MLAKVPRNVELVLNGGDMVRVYRETDRNYAGPYPVQCIDGTQVFVLVNDREVQHSLDRVVLAKECDDLLNGDSLLNVLYASTKQFRSTKPKRKPSRPEVMITEVLHLCDPRNIPKEATDTKRKEIEALVQRGTWKIALNEDIPKGSNITNGRFFVAIKNVETNEPYCKARFVAQGHRDRENQ